MSSINDGPQSVSPTDIDFATAFDDICQTLQQRVQSPDVQFISENPYNSYPTRLDIGRIQQVVTNFVINAVKYTSQGHIRVGWKPTSDPSLLGMRTVTSSDEKASEKNIHFPPLQEGAGGGADGLLIYCEDTGTGIPKDKQASIFERFVKLNEFVQGTGLGLSICKSIAERCGGHIGVESEGEGYGSTFWIWIPCPHTSTPIEQHQKSDSHESAKL